MARFIHMRTTGYILPLLMALFALWIVGCDHESDDIPSDPAVTVDVLVQQGWDSFNEGDYDAAVESFTNAANAQADYLEAYLGLGYCFAQIPDRLTSAQTNFDKVITFSDLLVTEGDTTQTYADLLQAESYAGMAALELAEDDYTNVLVRADQALAIDPDFQHRWVETFNVRKLMVLKAEAYFASAAYDQCLFILEEIEAGFEADLISDGILMVIEDEECAVVLDTNPMHTGTGVVSTMYDNLVYPSAVEDDDLELPNGSPVSYEIVVYTVAGASITFRANPLPQMGDIVLVSYEYASDFGEFLLRMREELDQL